MRRLTCEPTLEVLGQNIRAFTDNLESDLTAPIMRKYGLWNVAPDGWYPVVNLLDALNEMAETTGGWSSMVAIGMEIGRIIPIPPHIENPTLPDVLAIWNDLYQYLHRNGETGEIRVERVSEKHYKTIHTDLYPDDLGYGILYSYARRFLPPGTQFKVFYDPDLPGRDTAGGDKTVLHVTWE